MFAIKQRHIIRQITCYLFLALFALVHINGAQAQTMLPVSSEETTQETKIDLELNAPNSKEAVRALVAELNDDDVRALLIDRLDAVAETKENKASDVGALEFIGKRFSSYLQYAKESVQKSHEVSSTITKIKTILSNELSGGLGKLLLIILIAIAAGIAAERLVATLLKKRKQKLIDSTSTTLWGILKIIYTRLTYDILGVLAFTLVSYIIISSNYHIGSIIHTAAGIIVVPIAATWLAYVVCRFFFAPKRPDLRICRTTDERAQRLTVSFSLLAGFIVLMHNLFYTFLEVGFQDYGGYGYMRTLGYWMNLFIYIVPVFVIWYNRQGLTDILVENKKRGYQAIGEQAPEDISWFAVHWPKIAMILIVCKYFLVELVVNSSDVAVYSTGAVYMTFIVIFLWPGIDANVSLFVNKGITPAEDESENAAKARRSMQLGLLRVGRILVVGITFYALANLWGLKLMDLAHSGLGAKAAGNLVELLFIILTAYILWELVSALIGYWIAQENSADEHGGEGGGEIGGVGLSRVATLLPIIRGTVRFLIIVVSIIMVLDNWGVNIGPIIAGAGVIGLAIGFGAQTLVKDIVSGLFFLADDAFRVGEYIDVGGTMGNVEKISLRSLRLRHHRGLVHTIPYGEIPKLTNFSRDWVIMKLRFRVPFDTDINKVKKIFKGIGASLLEDPILGEDFLEPFKSQGVAEVDDNGIVVRGKFMAKPGKQFMIRKEVYVRVQKAFDEAGIPFARKQVMVHIPGLDKNEELDPNELKAIGAAAAESAEELPVEEQTKPKPA